MLNQPPQLKLCTFDRSTNVCFESHDPSLMKDPKSIWYYSYSTDTAIISKYEMHVEIHDVVIKGRIIKCWDFENGRPSVCFTGLSKQGISYWGKLINR